MKTYLFYRPRTEADRLIQTFLRRLDDIQQAKLTLIDIHTRDGDALSRAYGLTSYPSLVVASANGSVVRMWHGELPPLSEITFYLA